MPPHGGRLKALRAALQSVWWAARAYRSSTALIVIAAATAVAAALPLTWLGGATVVLGGVRDPGFPLVLSIFSATPMALQQSALRSLVGVLAILGVAILAVSIITILALSVGRAATRRREMSIRRAVGASRGQLRVTGTVEGAAFIATALGVGVPVSILILRWVTVNWPGTIDPALVWPLAGVGVLSAMVLGGALEAIRTPRVLRVAEMGVTTHGLVAPALQFGVSLAILITAAQLSRHARDLLGGRGAAGAGGQVVEFTGDSVAQRRALEYSAVLERLRASGRFSTVSLSSAGASLGLGPVDLVTTDCGACAEGGVATPFRPAAVTLNAVSSDTFRAMAIPVLHGRGIVDGDDWRAPRVAVVSQTLAALDYERRGAVGRQVRVGRGASAEWYTVVGIVADHPGLGLGGALEPPKAVYVSALQVPPRAVDLLVRPMGDGSLVLPPTLPGTLVRRVSERALMEEVARPVLWFERLAGGAGIAVLGIAIIGMFAVMEQWVVALAPELAVRRAVGARRWRIMAYVLARALGVALGGVCFGLWVGQLSADGLETAIAALPQPGAGLIAGIAGVLVAAALAGALVPAWRAARAQPSVVMAMLDG